MTAPLRRAGLIRRRELGRRGHPDHAVVGAHIALLLAELEQQTARDPGVALAWHTLDVTVRPDTRRRALRVSVTIALEEEE